MGTGTQQAGKASWPGPVNEGPSLSSLSQAHGRIGLLMRLGPTAVAGAREEIQNSSETSPVGPTLQPIVEEISDEQLLQLRGCEGSSG